jgi:PIN domain nuclease of toxin-antitoxin system
VKILLDTHTMIWALLAPDKLSKRARQALENPDNRVFVSAVSFWEISLKEGMGKLRITGAKAVDFPRFCEEQGWELLPLDPRAAAGYGSLSQPTGHKDPFDRMLAHVAISGGMGLVSRDKAMDAYKPDGLKRLW